MRLRADGLMALASQALGVDCDPSKDHRRWRLESNVAVLPVRGPLAHHVLPELTDCDSYESILIRVKRAIANPEVQQIALILDSPGGAVSGCYDTARDIRRLCALAKKPLVAFCENALSASYALACAADRIVASPSSLIGSIGVIAVVLDESASLEPRGLRVDVLTSGARKGDSHEHNPRTESAIAALQRGVDESAAQFFEWVAERRPLLTVELVEKLEADIFSGRESVALGLVDSICTLEEFLESYRVQELALEAKRTAQAAADAALYAADETRVKQLVAQAARAHGLTL